MLFHNVLYHSHINVCIAKYHLKYFVSIGSKIARIGRTSPSSVQARRFADSNKKAS